MKGKILNHIGITINTPADIKDFYTDILGLEAYKNLLLNL